MHHPVYEQLRVLELEPACVFVRRNRSGTMSLLCYFSTAITDQKLLDPQGALARDVPSSAISATNTQFFPDNSFPHVFVDVIAANHCTHTKPFACYVHTFPPRFARAPSESSTQTSSAVSQAFLLTPKNGGGMALGLVRLRHVTPDYIETTL